MTRLTTLTTLTAATAMLVTAPAFAAPVTFGQTSSDANTGTGDFGQAFVLNADGDSDFAAPAYTLDSATFFRGSDQGGSSTLYLDVYQNDGAGESATFSSSGAPADVSYLGSSTNFVNHDAASQGNALNFTFSGITLDPETKYYLVFSSDAGAGNLVGTSTRQFGANSGFNYVNIDDVDTAPLLGGNEAGDTGDSSTPDSNGFVANEHQFTATVTAVPEPASAFAVVGGLALLAARRRR